MDKDDIETIDRTQHNPTKSGHIYASIVASGSSTIHAGDSHVTHIHHYHFRESTLGSSRESPTVDYRDASLDSRALSTKRKRKTGENEQGPRLEDQSQLEKALRKLGKFSTSIGHDIMGAEAAKVAQRITAVLDALKDSNTPSGSGHADNEFDRLKCGVLITRRIGINSSTKHLTMMPDARIERVTRRRDDTEFRGCSISLSTRTVEYRDENGTATTESFSELRLGISDQHQESWPHVSVLFFERADYHQSSFVPPVILAPSRWTYALPTRGHIVRITECETLDPSRLNGRIMLVLSFEPLLYGQPFKLICVPFCQDYRNLAETEREHWKVQPEGQPQDTSQPDLMPEGRPALRIKILPGGQLLGKGAISCEEVCEVRRDFEGVMTETLGIVQSDDTDLLSRRIGELFAQSGTSFGIN